MSKYCWPLRGVVRLRSADISMSAPAAHIVLRSRITAAVIAIAQSVRPLLANGGLLHGDENCSHALPARGLHTPPPPGPSGAAEQKGDLRSLVSCQRGNSSRSRSRSQTPRCRDWFLQCVAHLEPKAQASSPCPLRDARRSSLAGAIRLTTTNRSSPLCHPINSCAASCCICFRKASCVSGTSVS